MSPSHPRVPVLLEVVANVPTDFFHCMHCERLFSEAGIGTEVRREMQAGYPPQMLEEAGRLSTWLQELSARWGQQLHIRVIDPQSPEGLYKSLRYWVRRYPTFIINRRKKHTGWDPDAVERLIVDCGGSLDLA
ncbi:MAG: hypothetical protein PVH80_06055 [Anaerolineae bacterium]